jgi:hypothetical protein
VTAGAVTDGDFPPGESFNVLIVTNGSSAVATLDAAGIPGEKLTWDDVLHDGPVPAGLELSELSAVRARFIADCDWGPAEEVLEAFRRRDERLAAAAGEDEVLLWFEHDLYDQLQLLQVLDWFATPARRPRRLTLICRAAYVSHEPADALLAALEAREAVGPAELRLARQVWTAFRASDPNALAALLAEDTSDLPFAGAALRRFLEEYPWVTDGLARTERQALTAARDNPGSAPGDLFVSAAMREEPRYLGDWSFFRYLDGLRRGPLPLLFEEPSGGLTLTRVGEDVLAGRADRVRLRGVERWYGGVRMTGGNVWRWNPETGSPQVD